MCSLLGPPHRLSKYLLSSLDTGGDEKWFLSLRNSDYNEAVLCISQLLLYTNLPECDSFNRTWLQFMISQVGPLGCVQLGSSGEGQFLNLCIQIVAG